MSPQFTGKDEALEYAQQVLAQLKAAGYQASLVVEPDPIDGAPAGSPPPPVPTPPAPSQDAAAPLPAPKTKGKPVEGQGKKSEGEPDAVVAEWLSVAGGAGAGKVSQAGPGGQEATPVPPDAQNQPVPAMPLVVPPPPAPQDLTGDHLVTPLTADLWDRAEKAGAVGLPLLIGGEDLEDMQATVVAYRKPGGHGVRHVVWCKLRPDAEEKLWAAVSAAQGLQYMTVTHEVEVSGRAPWDEAKDVAGQIVKYAKSVNHHVGQGTAIPDYTLSGIKELRAYLQEVATGASPLGGHAALWQQYDKDLQELEEAVAKGTKTAHKNYGPHAGPHTRLVTEKVPVPVAPGQQTLAMEARPGTRIDAKEQGGIAYWDGKKRVKADGKEMSLDFGDGWAAVYHPHAKEYGVPWSHAGTLEILPPAGADPAGITEHLQRLYVQGAPMSRQEAEAIYLERNVWAQGLTRDKEYLRIRQYLDLRRQELAAELVLSGEYTPDDAGMSAAILRVEREVLPEKVGLLRRMFEAKMGLPEGALAKHPRYRPDPQWDMAHAAQGTGGEGIPGGIVTWERFDIDPAEVQQLFGSRVLGHSLTGNRMENLKRIILGGGVLAAQEKRHQMGAAPEGSTMSPGEDQYTGGAAYIFLRVGVPGNFSIEWDPAVLLSRSDWFFRNADNFGAVNPSNSHYKVKPSTKVEVASAATSSSNEICFKNGISLFGRYAPRRIPVGAAYRTQVLGWFKQAGVTHLGGRPVEEVVV